VFCSRVAKPKFSFSAAARPDSSIVASPTPSTRKKIWTPRFTPISPA